MPVEPLEERSEAAMATRLATIQSGSNYWTSPLVTRALLPIDQYQDADLSAGVLGVMRASGSTLAQVAQPATWAHAHRVAVWGYVLGDAAIAAGTRLNRLLSDVRACLLGDDTLGGLVMDLRPDEDLPIDTDDGAREPRAFFRQHWRVTAYEEIGAA